MLNVNTIASVMVAIIGTGAVLNMAGSGYLGATVQKGAKFITQGYGV